MNTMQISSERLELIQWCWENETIEDETQEWRDELSELEGKMVDAWDKKFETGLANMVKKVKELTA